MEVLVTIVIASMAILGFGYFFVEAVEEMRISWQLRDAEQYGYYYTEQFRDKVRNGVQATLTHLTAPSSLTVLYKVPFDNTDIYHLYSFEYDRRSRMPIIKRDGVTLDYPGFPPPSPSGRDEVYIPDRSFLIYEDDRKAPSGIPPEDYDTKYRPYYWNLEFSMIYHRYPLVQSRGTFEKEIDFSTGAYEMNQNWVQIPTDSTSTSTSGNKNY